MLRVFRPLRWRHSAHKRFWDPRLRISETACRALQDVNYTLYYTLFFFEKNSNLPKLFRASICYAYAMLYPSFRDNAVKELSPVTWLVSFITGNRKCVRNRKLNEKKSIQNSEESTFR